MGLEELEHDPRFNSIEARKANAKQLVSILDGTFITKTRDEWAEIFKKENIIYALIQTPVEVVNDLQALANEYVIWVDDPVWSKTKQVGFPWMFSETPASVRRVAPELGEHTEEILLDLGYNWDDISELRQDGII